MSCTISCVNAEESKLLCGPLQSSRGVELFLKTIQEAKSQGAQLLYGGERLPGEGFFVRPAIMKATIDMPVVAHETFAPILYVLKFKVRFTDSLMPCRSFYGIEI